MAIPRLGVITNWDALEEQIIFYRDHLDIFIEDAFAPIKLTKGQHIMARAFGRCDNIVYVQSRGSGKTWNTAICCTAIAVLYPGSNIAVTAPTASQATLVLDKIRMLAAQNKNIANELTAGSARSLVQLSKDKGVAIFKNGQKIESHAMGSMRGLRAKVVVVDEARDVDYELMDTIVSPIKNETRQIAMNKFKDYESKMVRITSACEKALPFYDDFVKTLKEMANGKQETFVCATDYRTAIYSGLTSEAFFESERARMPDAAFQMEYGSRFLGTNSNSAFPFDLVQTCRTLKHVEMYQPKNSKSRYVVSLDIATSEANDADKSIISVLKFTERADGTFSRKLVYMRSFKGKTLDVLAEEIRKTCHVLFPNTEKVVYDARGLGDSFDRFFDKDWIDIVSGKEYPPLAVDDVPNHNPVALPLLRPFRAVQQLNQRMYTNMRVALEKRSIEIPVSARLFIEENRRRDDSKTQVTPEELSIYYEADVLQIEMGNIVQMIQKSGNVLYDTPNHRQHKDRYSQLAMANDYISELEKENVKRYSRGSVCIGLATYF